MLTRLHRLMFVLLLAAAAALAGCYQYTITEADGTKRRISKKEYEQIKNEAPNRQLSVPKDF